MLSELEAAFTERSGAYLRPYGNLSPGSLVMVGSLSHLKTRGVADYAEALVRTLASLSAKLGGG